MPLTQQELDNIKLHLYQNGMVMDKGGVIITVNKVCKILELFLNQLKDSVDLEYICPDCGRKIENDFGHDYKPCGHRIEEQNDGS